MKRIIVKLVDAGDIAIVVAKEIRSLIITKTPELASALAQDNPAYFIAVWDQHTGQLEIQNQISYQGW